MNIKKYIFRFFQIAVLVYAILVTVQLIDCINDDNHHNHNKELKSSRHIEHSGIIQVSRIDKDKNGKVYQDQMDWNIISDEPGECPKCKMALKEVTIKEAEENLVKNGFEIK